MIDVSHTQIVQIGEKRLCAEEPWGCRVSGLAVSLQQSCLSVRSNHHSVRRNRIVTLRYVALPLAGYVLVHSLEPSHSPSRCQCQIRFQRCPWDCRRITERKQRDLYGVCYTFHFHQFFHHLDCGVTLSDFWIVIVMTFCRHRVFGEDKVS